MDGDEKEGRGEPLPCTLNRREQNRCSGRRRRYVDCRCLAVLFEPLDFGLVDFVPQHGLSTDSAEGLAKEFGLLGEDFLAGGGVDDVLSG